MPSLGNVDLHHQPMKALASIPPGQRQPGNEMMDAHHRGHHAIQLAPHLKEAGAVLVELEIVRCHLEIPRRSANPILVFTPDIPLKHPLGSHGLGRLGIHPPVPGHTHPHTGSFVDELDRPDPLIPMPGITAKGLLDDPKSFPL